jgi:putative ribosome biogenesis GTPase RsgA
VTEPYCGIKEAVEQGSVSRGRYQRYTELYAVLKLQYDMKYKKANRKGTKSND